MSESNNNYVAEAQAQEEPTITLTLTPDEVEKENEEMLASLEEKKAALEAKPQKDPLEEMKLTETERRTVNEFSEKINITDSNTVLQYGAAAQKKITDFSDTALKNVRTKDLGEIGTLLSDLVV